MKETRTCMECKSPLPEGLPEVFCPACALRRALGMGIPPASGPPSEGSFLEGSSQNLTPAQQFDRQWASAVFDQARAKLSQECVASGKSGLHERVPLLDGKSEDSPAYAVIAQELGMSVSAIKSAVSRLRDRYAELVREEVAHTVCSPAEVPAELRYLLSLVAS